MRLYIIRHGETEYNKQRIVQGYGEIPLNDEGIAQAARLADRLAEARVDEIVSSDLRRAVMTAAIAAARTGAHIRYDTDFRERNPGSHVDQHYDEAAAFFTDYHYEPPEGESVAAFNERVRAAFEALAKKDGATDKHIALVTHGMVCAAFAHVYLEHDNILETTGNWRNTSITVVDYKDGQWTLVALGDAAHLDPIDDEAHSTGA
jgi:broad specificity phosphatase PhoE